MIQSFEFIFCGFVYTYSIGGSNPNVFVSVDENLIHMVVDQGKGAVIIVSYMPEFISLLIENEGGINEQRQNTKPTNGGKKCQQSEDL